MTCDGFQTRAKKTKTFMTSSIKVMWSNSKQKSTNEVLFIGSFKNFK